MPSTNPNSCVTRARIAMVYLYRPEPETLRSNVHVNGRWVAKVDDSIVVSFPMQFQPFMHWLLVSALFSYSSLRTFATVLYLLHTPNLASFHRSPVIYTLVLLSWESHLTACSCAPVCAVFLKTPVSGLCIEPSRTQAVKSLLRGMQSSVWSSRAFL